MTTQHSLAEVVQETSPHTDAEWCIFFILPNLNPPVPSPFRLDDQVTCKACGKRFEIPSQQSVMFADQFAGLPNEEDLEREIAAAAGEPEPEPVPTKLALRARFTHKSTGWK